MASERRLKGPAEAIGFFLGAILLGALVCIGTASAQCGPAGPASAENTACGTRTLAHNTTGVNDSTFGFNALHSNTTGNYNTASGVDTLFRNTTGNYNTASGVDALSENITGDANTASGTAALHSNTSGLDNTASGANALYYNTTGSYNTASGVLALVNNTTGFNNTASGFKALASNTTSYDNTASGADALYSNTIGFANTASGAGALSSNTMGFTNTASGVSALAKNTMGSGNIGIGVYAGGNIVAGSNNINIGGGPGVDESDTIRIGTPGTQSATYIAGIYGIGVSSTNPICVISSGQLGICSSSARYKRDIRDMGTASNGLMRLRPVVFRYQSDPKGQRQYGLIAEEVARVYPELVDYDNDGKPLAVHYLELSAMLLNELQTQARETQQLVRRLEAKDRQLAAQQREIDALRQQNASSNALRERLAILERQVRMANADGLRPLARK